MQIKHKLVFSLAALSLVGISLVGATNAFAQGNGTQSSFISELAQKLGIDPAKVQHAVTSIKQEHQAKMQTNYQNKLEQEVKQGTITEAQKTAIINELAQLQAKYNPASMKSMTPAQRKQIFQQEQTEIQAWAKDQGIDPKYLKVRFWGARGRWGMKQGVKISPTPSPTPNT